MRLSYNLENKIPSDILKSSATMDVISDLLFFGATTGIKSGPDAFDESRFLMTF